MPGSAPLRESLSPPLAPSDSSSDNLGLSASSRGALIVPASIFRRGVLVIAGIR